MQMEKVLEAAKPYLEGRKVIDIVVGISLLGVQLDNGKVGVSYLLRNSLPAGCGAFPTVIDDLLGNDAEYVARQIIDGQDMLCRGIGSAVLAAAASQQDIPADNVEGIPFELEINSDTTVGMVGLIVPVAMEIAKLTDKFIIFDNDKFSIEGLPPVQKPELQEELLPTCDIVLLSGTTTINGTIDELLYRCRNAREIVMIGQSTPMFAEGWRGSGVTRLAGSTWRNEDKEAIFADISRACGTGRLVRYMQKKRLNV